MLMKTQPLSRCREILGLPARRISRVNSIGYDLRIAHYKNYENIFCLQVYPRMYMKTNNRSEPNPRMLMIIKLLSLASQNVPERKGVTCQNRREKWGVFAKAG